MKAHSEKIECSIIMSIIILPIMLEMLSTQPFLTSTIYVMITCTSSSICISFFDFYSSFFKIPHNILFLE